MYSSFTSTEGRRVTRVCRVPRRPKIYNVVIGAMPLHIIWFIAVIGVYKVSFGIKYKFQVSRFFSLPKKQKGNSTERWSLTCFILKSFSDIISYN